MAQIATRSNPTNHELGVLIPEQPSFKSSDLFCIFPPNIPDGSQPIFDEKTRACIGYSYEGAKGVWRIYNSFGDAVGLEEVPLEPSPFGPEDVFLLGLTLLKVGRFGWSAGKALNAKGVSTAAVRFAGQLRARLLTPRSLRGRRIPK